MLVVNAFKNRIEKYLVMLGLIVLCGLSISKRLCCLLPFDVLIGGNLVKCMFLYSVQYPVRCTAQSALHFSSPDRPVHSDTNSTSLGSILAMQQLRVKTSFTFPLLPVARYSFIQLSELGRRGENENARTLKR